MFDAQDAPQPPKVLTTPLEIASNLRMLQESHDPLINLQTKYSDTQKRHSAIMLHVSLQRVVTQVHAWL